MVIENYFFGKTIKKDEFMDYWKRINTGELSRNKAASMIGINVVTLRKWLRLAAESMNSYGRIDFDNLTFIE